MLASSMQAYHVNDKDDDCEFKRVIVAVQSPMADPKALRVDL